MSNLFLGRSCSSRETIFWMNVPSVVSQRVCRVNKTVEVQSNYLKGHSCEKVKETLIMVSPILSRTSMNWTSRSWSDWLAPTRNVGSNTVAVRAGDSYLSMRSLNNQDRRTDSYLNDQWRRDRALPGMSNSTITIKLPYDSDLVQIELLDFVVHFWEYP